MNESGWQIKHKEYINTTTTSDKPKTTFDILLMSSAIILHKSLNATYQYLPYIIVIAFTTFRIKTMHIVQRPCEVRAICFQHQ